MTAVLARATENKAEVGFFGRTNKELSTVKKAFSYMLTIAALSTVASTAPSANANWRRVHHSACSISSSTTANIQTFLHYRTVKDGGVQIICPLEDASGFPKSGIDHINVHTFDSTSDADNYGRAYVCAQDPFGTTAACLQAQGASGSGHNTLALNTSAELDWLKHSSRSSYFATVVASLQSAQTTGLGQWFYGYWVTD